MAQQETRLNLINLYSKLLLLVFLAIVASGECEITTSLPGFTGNLPFKLETGYVGVGEKEEVQLFYYFVESEGSPAQDPLMLWISGGPGCSSLGAFFYENGPLSFDLLNYNGGLPRLLQNPYAWTKVLNIIYLDLPVGTGFSYSRTQEGYSTGDVKSVANSYEFLLKWLAKHPKFLKNPFYIAGEGYSGNPIPILAQEVLNGNKVGQEPSINLKGYVLGNPGTDVHIDFNSRIPYAYRLALIPDELYESARTNCNGDYVSPPTNEQCKSDIDTIHKLFADINWGQVLEPSCSDLSLDVKTAQAFLKEKSRELRNSYPVSPPSWCQRYSHMLNYIWANAESVQEALHVRQGTKASWLYCNDTMNKLYSHDVSSVVGYHQNFTKTNLQALIYSGDHDLSIPYIGTQQWIWALNLTLKEEGRAWSCYNQTAGYTRKFIKNNFSLTYATIKGAGHFAAEYRVKECFAMIARWMAYHHL